MSKQFKLSELQDSAEISCESPEGSGGRVYTAGLVRDAIKAGSEVHLTKVWFTIKREKVQMSAEDMLGGYFDKLEDDSYKGYSDNAFNHISNEATAMIQKILDYEFKFSSINEYWRLDKPVEIDVFPERGEDLFAL